MREDGRSCETQKFFRRARDPGPTVSPLRARNPVSTPVRPARAASIRHETMPQSSTGCRSSDRTTFRLKPRREYKDVATESTCFLARTPPGDADSHRKVLQTRTDRVRKAVRARLPSDETRWETHQPHPRVPRRRSTP